MRKNQSKPSIGGSSLALPYARWTSTQVTFPLSGILGYHLSHVQVSSGEYWVEKARHCGHQIAARHSDRGRQDDFSGGHPKVQEEAGRCLEKSIAAADLERGEPTRPRKMSRNRAVAVAHMP